MAINKKGGFTLIEIVIVLAIIAILAGILAPTLTRYVGDSKIRRAEGDVQRIAVAMGAFYSDVGEWPIWSSGSATTPGATKFKALQGIGDNPTLTGAGWPDFTTNASDITGIKDQLISNTPAYPTTGKRAWRGPYLDDIKTDPWGSKYVVNVEFVWPANVSGAKPVFVLSPGPDKEVDTAYSQTGPDLAVTDDDIVFRIK
jgi:prepilin-type N-terminal cleavage/methylation domain-containing protein